MLRLDVAGLRYPKLALALLLTCTCSTFAAPAPRLPVEFFFREPFIQNLKLSPSGRYLAAVQDTSLQKEKGQKKGPYLVNLDLETGQRNIVVASDILDYEWIDDGRILFQDGDLGAGGLFSVNRDGSKLKILEPPVKIQRIWINTPVRIVDFLCVAPDEPDSVLIERAEFFVTSMAGQIFPDVLRLNVLTGKASVEVKNPGNVLEWCIDDLGKVRAAVAVEKDELAVLYRAKSDEKWKTVARTGNVAKHMRPLGFKPGTPLMYVCAFRDAETQGLYTFDCEQQSLAECLWSNDRFDLSDVVYQRDSRRITGVIFEGERFTTHWFNAELRAAQAKVDAVLPGRVNAFVTSNRDGVRHLVKSYSDRHFPEYFLIDIQKGTFSLIAKERSWLKPEDMAEQKPITYQSRDGLTIHGFLTLPRGVSPEGLPMVVMPHGGPWLRDNWGAQPENQFLANRGYAVLQVNFRGSTGYGWKFQEAGFRQWGRKMQDDITDGVKWAISQGIADRRRIAIFGASYGGYAALMGLATTPELYRCGISYAGVTDIARSYIERPSHRIKVLVALVETMVGDYRQEKKELDAFSPVNLAQQITAPVLLAYGAKDEVVNLEQGERMAKALKKAGKQHELIIEKEEGHGFFNETNRIELFQRIESFLEKNMK